MQNEMNDTTPNSTATTASYPGYTNDSSYNMNSSANSEYGKLLFGMFAGAMAGAATVLLMDKATRSNVASSAVTVKDMTITMARDLKNDPKGFVSKIQEKSEVVSSIAQEASRSIQQIADKAMEAKEYSMEAVNVASEAMGEMKDVASSAVQKASTEMKDIAPSDESSSNIDRRAQHGKTDRSPDGTVTP